MRAGITQRELGRRVGMEADGASARISQYETGIHQPYFPTAERIAKELGVPVAYLYADSERLARLILVFSALDAVEQERVLAAIERKDGDEPA